MRRLHLLLGLVCAGPFASAAVAEALSDHDNGPLTGYFGIPDSTEGALLAKPRQPRWDLRLQTSSHSISDDGRGESIILDGETTRLELVWRVGLGDQLELGVELPYLWHESGGLDSMIETWHDVLGFPGGFRGKRPNNELEFLYEDASGTQINFTRNAKGIGDLRLLAAWRIRRSETFNLALRAGLKLPTGDSAELLGSGGADLSIGIVGDHSRLFGIDGLSAFYRANAVLIGEPDLLADRYREVVGHVGFGVGYLLTERIDLRVQGTIRSAIYHSPIEVLGDPAGTATFGGNIRLGKDFWLSVAVSEDVKVRSAPDVSFRLGLRYRPGPKELL